MPISTYTDGVGDAFRSIGEYASGLVAPTVFRSGGLESWVAAGYPFGN